MRLTAGNWLGDSPFQSSIPETLPETDSIIINLQNDSGVTYDPETNLLSAWVCQASGKTFAPPDSRMCPIMSSANAINGLPSIGISWNTTSSVSRYIRNDSDWGELTDEITVAMVVKMADVTSAGTNDKKMFFFSDNPTGSGELFGFNSPAYIDSAWDYAKGSSYGLRISLGGDIRDVWKAIIVRGRYSGGKTYLKTFVDAEAIEEIEAKSSTDSATSCDIVSIGSVPNLHSHNFTGFLGAFIAWNESLTDEQCLLASQYIMHKYSIGGL